MKRKAPKQQEQLGLWDITTEPAPAPAAPVAQTLDTEQHQTETDEKPSIDPEWTREGLAAWLSQWGCEHHFPRLTFTLFDGKKGYTGVAESGQENWTRFLETAGVDILMRARMSAEARKYTEPAPAPSSTESDLDYLLKWGERHSYPELEFPLPRPYSGFSTAVIRKGKDAFTRDCNNFYSSAWVHSAAQLARKLEQS